jgi:VanZ family protein
MSRDPVILIMIHIFLLAGGTEMAQFYIDGRSPLFWDFVIDIGGGLSGILLIELSGINKSKITNSGLKP